MDKVEQITGIIGDRGSWDVHELGGELVMVDVPGRPGVKQKMHKSRAIALGLWKEPEPGPEAKALPATRNKVRRPGRNKAQDGQ
jgi:hypothetical protein